MGNFATIEDLELLWHSLKFDERARAEALRSEESRVGKECVSKCIYSGGQVY